MDIDSLMHRFRGPLIGLLAARGASARDARELAQDVFAEAYLSRARFRGDWGDDGAAGAWLRGIANRLHMAHRRSGRRFGAPQPEREAAQEDTTGAELEARESQALLRAAIDGLPESWRTVLLMHYVEGNALAEIGALLGLSERSVEGRLHRARKELKQRLEGNGPAADLGRDEGTSEAHERALEDHR